jgi:hypothetical protein
MKVSVIVIGALIAMTLITGCVTTEVKESGPYETNVVVPAHKAHEDCFKLADGQSLDFAFESSAALDFNLHCHEEGEILMPIDLKGVSAKSDTFVADRDQYWCLMWENKHSRKVRLSYEFTIGEE